MTVAIVVYKGLIPVVGRILTVKRNIKKQQHKYIYRGIVLWFIINI